MDTMPLRRAVLLMSQDRRYTLATPGDAPNIIHSFRFGSGLSGRRSYRRWARKQWRAAHLALRHPAQFRAAREEQS